MATDAMTDMTQAELLYAYLGLRLAKGDRKVTIDRLMAEFPDYLRQREIVREMIRAAKESIASGRSGPLDLEKTIDEVIQELASEGITD